MGGNGIDWLSTMAGFIVSACIIMITRMVWQERRIAAAEAMAIDDQKVQALERRERETKEARAEAERRDEEKRRAEEEARARAEAKAAVAAEAAEAAEAPAEHAAAEAAVADAAAEVAAAVAAEAAAAEAAEVAKARAVSRRAVVQSSTAGVELDLVKYHYTQSLTAETPADERRHRALMIHHGVQAKHAKQEAAEKLPPPPARTHTLIPKNDTDTWEQVIDHHAGQARTAAHNADSALTKHHGDMAIGIREWLPKKSKAAASRLANTYP